jgi:hypothetical protein
MKRFFVFALILAMLAVAMPALAAGGDIGPPARTLANTIENTGTYVTPSPAIIQAAAPINVEKFTLATLKTAAALSIIIALAVALRALLYYRQNGIEPTLAGPRQNRMCREQNLARDQSS